MKLSIYDGRPLTIDSPGQIVNVKVDHPNCSIYVELEQGWFKILNCCETFKDMGKKHYYVLIDDNDQRVGTIDPMLVYKRLENEMKCDFFSVLDNSLGVLIDQDFDKKTIDNVYKLYVGLHNPLDNVYKLEFIIQILMDINILLPRILTSMLEKKSFLDRFKKSGVHKLHLDQFVQNLKKNLSKRVNKGGLKKFIGENINLDGKSPEDKEILMGLMGE